MALGTANGRPILMAGYRVTDFQSRQIASEIVRLQSRLSPSSDNHQALAIELAKLFAAFPTQAQSDSPSDLRMEAYFEALSGLPAWAVGEARGRILRGDVTLDHRFAPTPPELRNIVGLVLRPLRGDLADLIKIREASGDREPLPGERERVSAGLDAYRAELAASVENGKAKPMTPAQARSALEARCAELGIDPSAIDKVPDQPSTFRRLASPSVS